MQNFTLQTKLIPLLKQTGVKVPLAGDVENFSVAYKSSLGVYFIEGSSYTVAEGVSSVTYANYEDCIGKGLFSVISKVLAFMNILELFNILESYDIRI